MLIDTNLLLKVLILEFFERYVKYNETVFGSPAINRRKYIQSYSIFKKLPEVEKRIKEIEKKLLKL